MMYHLYYLYTPCFSFIPRPPPNYPAVPNRFPFFLLGLEHLPWEWCPHSPELAYRCSILFLDVLPHTNLLIAVFLES